MKTKHSISSLVLAAALVAGFATPARADSGLPEQPAPAAADTAVGQGLLGQVYGTLTYSYIDLDGVSNHGDDYHIALTQPLSFGLDGFLSYDFVDYNVGHQNIVMAGLRPFSTRFNWGKPYVEAGAGYAWTSGDNSFVWEVAVGTEFQVNPKTTVTPYVQYTDAPDLAGDGTWTFGAKGNYWVNSQWSVTAGVELSDEKDVGFTVGTNFRF